MNLKGSPFAIQDKNARDLDNAKDFPTIADLMRENKRSHKMKEIWFTIEEIWTLSVSHNNN